MMMTERNWQWPDIIIIIINDDREGIQAIEAIDDQRGCCTDSNEVMTWSSIVSVVWYWYK